MTNNENPDKGPLLTAQVIALGALAYLDGQMCRLGCKLFVKAALHSPTPTAVEFCHVMEKRFYFRGMSARDTLADCIAYLDPAKAPEPKPHQELGPLHWNGETFETEAEYHAAVNAYREAFLAKERKEIEAEMGRSFSTQEEYEREARTFLISEEKKKKRRARDKERRDLRRSLLAKLTKPKKPAQSPKKNKTRNVRVAALRLLA